MSKYTIIGGDGKEYGPVSAAEVQQWVTSGRASGDTRIQCLGDDGWTRVRDVPELTTALTSSFQESASRSISTTSSYAAHDIPPLPPDIESRDHDLWGAGCLNRGATVYQTLFGPSTGMIAAFFGILIAVIIAMITAQIILLLIPLVGILIAIALRLVVSLSLIPLYAGPTFFFINAIRNQPTRIGLLFAGYSRAFGQCILFGIVQSLIIMVSMIPGFAIAFFSVGWPFAVFFIDIYQAIFLGGPSPSFPEFTLLNIIGFLGGLLIACLPVIYLSTCWAFSLPLVVDRKMNFWSAMELSRKVVNKHWFMVFLFSLVVGVIASSGAVVCGIGLLFTVPLGIAMYAAAYVHLFDER